MKLDILAFGAHPDDVELSCAGTIMVEIANGKKCGVIDLTQGELGTRGTIETRYSEAESASKIMGLHIRENLKMADGFFANDRAHQLLIIQAIRTYQPEVVLCNAIYDRHPDHGRSASLVADASFLSGLRKIETYNTDGTLQPAWKPKQVFHYIQDKFITPHFVVDITNVHERKVAAVNCYGTQFFNPNHNEPNTYISTPAFMESVIYRSKMMGKIIGVPFAEGYISNKALGITSFDAFINNAT